MAGRKLRVEWGNEETPEVFRTLYRAERNGKLKERLHALWLLRLGWTARQVAAVLGVHYRTVHRWVRWYRDGGLAEVLSHRQGGSGRKSYLDNDEMTLLGWEVESGCFGTAKDVRDWIEAECGVRYTMPGVYSLIRRLS